MIVRKLGKTIVKTIALCYNIYMENKFKYKFNKLILLCLILSIALLVAYLTLAVITTFEGTRSIVVTLALPLVFFSLALFVLIEFFKSNYTIDEKGLFIKLSIAKFLVDIENIKILQFDKTNNRLVLHYISQGNLRLNFLSINDIDFIRFKEQLLKIKPSVIYEEITDIK